MDTQSTTDSPSTHNFIFLNGKQLAEVLDVSAPSLSQAVKQGHKCGGYPVCEWAIETESGRIKGYEVPEFLISEETEKLEKRTNPEQKAPNKPNINPNTSQKPENQVPSVTNNNYSMLPQGEDYVRPVGMATLPSVLKKAIEYDTPQSRAVVMGGMTGLGAITGHAVTDSPLGAAVGAIGGLGIAFFSYWYFNSSNDVSAAHNFPSKDNEQDIVTSYVERLTQSGYLAN